MLVFIAGLVDGFIVELPGVAMLLGGVEIGAGVLTETGVETFAGLTVTLVLALSPQAIPKALSPRTVESTITFFI